MKEQAKQDRVMEVVSRGDRQEIKALLKSLRLRPDMVHVEPISGDRMWLKQVWRKEPVELKFGDKTITSRGYLEDCCLESDPCDWHAAVAEATKRGWVAKPGCGDA